MVVLPSDLETLGGKMNSMREIGRHIQAEQNLSEGEVTWLIMMAQAVLRAFSWEDGQPMRCLADRLGISPQTLYTTLRWVVQAMVWVYRHKAAIETLVVRAKALQSRLAQVEQTWAMAQAEVQRMGQALAEAQARIEALQTEVNRLQAQGRVNLDRLMAVLKMSGQCSGRSKL